MQNPAIRSSNAAGELALNGQAKARVLIVDDHPLIREGLAMLLQRQEDLECCGTADTAESALQATVVHEPDLVAVDLRLQHGDGLDLIRDLRVQKRVAPVLVISQCDEMLYAERALKLGARGYVMKDRPTTEVLIAMRTVLAGGLYVSPSVSALALNNLIGQSAGNLPHSCHNLSNRELQVLQLLGAGLGTRKISSRLGLSVKTIEAHRENIKHKLGLGCAAELVRYAVDWVNGTASQHSAQSSPMQQNLGV